MAADKQAFRRWEHRSVWVRMRQGVGVMDADLVKALDALGADGWELVGLIPSQSGVRCILKRPAQAPARTPDAATMAA